MIGVSALMSEDNLSKNDIRFWLLGALDELNCHLGLIKLESDGEYRDVLTGIQHNIMRLCSKTADWDKAEFALSGSAAAELKEKAAGLKRLYPKITRFIVPGESARSAHIDLARAAARTAERFYTAVCEKYSRDENGLAFLNVLSDFLYAYARYTDFIEDIVNSVRETVEAAAPAGIALSVAQNQKKIGLETAKMLCERAEHKAREMKLNAVVAVCSGSGNPIAVHAMDDAYLVSFDIAVAKAYTSAALKMPTAELARLVQPGQMFYGLTEFAGKKIIAIGGGVPLYDADTLIGGLGVSGGTAEEDAAIAEYAAREIPNKRR